MIELKIKKKYFDAILELKKPFELRHKPIEKGTIVKLVETEDCNGNIHNGKLVSSAYYLTGRYIIFESGECRELCKNNSGTYEVVKYKNDDIFELIFGERHCWNLILDTNCDWFDKDLESWYDKFCWDYINGKQTYLIEIAKILEVK